MSCWSWSTQSRACRRVVDLALLGPGVLTEGTLLGCQFGLPEPADYGSLVRRNDLELTEIIKILMPCRIVNGAMSSLYATKGAGGIRSSLSHPCCCSDAGMRCWKAQWSAEAALGVLIMWSHVRGCPVGHQLQSLLSGGLWSWCN